MAVGLADDDADGISGRPLRLACIGNIDIVAVMSVVESTRSGTPEVATG